VYTSGRWLRSDKLERDSRYISFDFDLLCKRVIDLCPGAVSIANYDKKEGGFNRVFIFTTDNAKRIVARLPFALAGPPRLRTSSEVATIKYCMFASMGWLLDGIVTPATYIFPILVQSHTGIPIPEILDWNDDASNPIGSEYIIMEHSPGVQLHHRWPTMTGEQQIRCIEAICQKAKEMVDVKFPVYGSLYFDHSLPSSAVRHKLDQGFSMGPHCGAVYWDCHVGESRYYHNVMPNQGPCKILVFS
jgi:hypothetical protein